MSGASAKFLYAAALLLACNLRSGEGLKCYESACLKDHTKSALNCREDEDGSDATLEDCTPAAFSQRWSDITQQTLTTGDMKCVKLEANGTLPKAKTGKDVIRTCFPETQHMCDTINGLVSTIIRNSDVKELKFGFHCHVCNNTDGCNSAPNYMIPSAVSFITSMIIISVTL